MTTLEIFTIIASMLGGLALFLFGMDTMSDSLSAMTGGALNSLLGKVTKNRLLAFLFGALVTALVQSASAITVLTVGLVNSGIIVLSKAIGLLIGANLGTTATAWVLSLNAIEGQSFLLTLIKPSSFSPFLAIIGVFMTMFCRADMKKNIGSTLLGFGVMMIGMNLMGQAVSPLKELPALQKALIGFTNPILGFLFACAFALLIQSSDAVVGILQAFALSVGITFGMAIPLICGAQVGTCVSALLASMGTSNNGKRTALMNLYYNLLKTIPFLIVFYVLNIFHPFSFLERTVGGIGIPMVHSLVNLLACLVWLPLSGVIVFLVNLTIPLSQKEKETQANTLTFLDENLLGTPGIALEQADRAVLLLSETVSEAFLTVIDMAKKAELSDQIQLLCDRTQKYRNQIDAYLAQISERDIGKKDRAFLRLLSSANSAFGRMGMVAERILKRISIYTSSAEHISPEELKEIHILGEGVFEIMQLTNRGFSARSRTISQTIRYYREEITEISSIIKRRSIHRAHSEAGNIELSQLYTDICYNEEQLIDYCDMIADALIRYEKEVGSRPLPDQEDDENVRRQVREVFKDKYEALKQE